MDSSQFDQYLNDRYCQQVTWYDNQAIFNQRCHRWLQTVLVCLAAVTPVLAMTSNTWLTAVAGTIVAVATGVSRVWKFEQNWVNYRTTCELLKKEQYYLLSRLGEYADAEDPHGVFVKRVEELIAREHMFWATAHRGDAQVKKPTTDKLEEGHGKETAA